MARTGTLSGPLAEAYQHCRAVTKDRAKNFYIAFLSLPREKRMAVYAVYAFCRTCDDLVDDDAAIGDKVRLLEAHRSALTACFEGDPQGPVFVALQDVSTRYSIPMRLFDDIITGVQMDLTEQRYATFDDLHRYCYHVASVVGLITIQIFGYKDEAAKQHAVDLGIAMQMVNILRDIKEDAARDRIYVPLEDLAAFGYMEAELLDGGVNDRFVALMRFEGERARAYFRRGAALPPLLSPDARACPAILAAVYARLLDRIEAGGWDIFTRRVSVPQWLKISIAAKIWMATSMKGVLKRGAQS